MTDRTASHFVSPKSEIVVLDPAPFLIDRIVGLAGDLAVVRSERDSALRAGEEAADTLKALTEQMTREREQMMKAISDASAEIGTLRRERDTVHVKHSRCFIAMSNLLAKSEEYLNNAGRKEGRRATINAFRLALAEAKEVYLSEIPF